MIGAIIGDLVGSRFEFNNHRSKDFELFTNECFITDDSVMTLAVCKALIENNDNTIRNNIIKFMKQIGKKYPDCGYGNSFGKWIFSDQTESYWSYGNGAAMRISGCAWMAESLHDAIRLSQIVTSVTHDHPEGIKGAEAVTVATYLARTGSNIQEIRDCMSDHYYNVDFTLDEIRSIYEFNETCQETVPQALEAFFESTSFEDAIRNAISIGGDSDTLAAITGSIAEAYYGVPEWMQKTAEKYMDNDLKKIYDEFNERLVTK